VPHLRIDVDAIRGLSDDLDGVRAVLGERGLPDADEFALGPGRAAERLTALLRDWEHRRLALMEDLAILSRATAAAASAYERADGYALPLDVCPTP
jgi:hypothetical protein